jgi:hypothetical protein
MMMLLVTPGPSHAASAAQRHHSHRWHLIFVLRQMVIARVKLTSAFCSVNGSQKRAGHEVQGGTLPYNVIHGHEENSMESVSELSSKICMVRGVMHSNMMDETSRQKQAPHRRVHEDAHTGYEYAGNQRLRLQQEQSAANREILCRITQLKSSEMNEAFVILAGRKPSNLLKNPKPKNCHIEALLQKSIRYMHISGLRCKPSSYRH